MSTEDPAAPPQNYVPYPRGAPTDYGTSARLRALSEGYFALNGWFAVNALLFLLWVLLLALCSGLLYTLPVLFAAILVSLFIGVGAYPSMKKVGFGANWRPGWSALASMLLGLNASMCCCLVGFVVIQWLIHREMRKYGLRPGFVGGVPREAVAAKLDWLESQGR